MRLLKIGSNVSCDIVLRSNKVSSLHAEIIMLNNGDILLEDKNSLNGTYVMNQRIKPNTSVNIRRGDIVRFADVELAWSQIPAQEDNSAYTALYGIGSNVRNQIQVTGATVSRFHATLKKGKDKKWYIQDHSKNGTTVNGQRITPGIATRVKHGDIVLCGGQPVDLRNIIPASTSLWKYIVGLAAVVLLAFGVYYLLPIIERGWSSEKVYKHYNNRVVMMVGQYHYEASAGDLNLSSIGMPTEFKVKIENNELVDLITSDEEGYDEACIFFASGFFVSRDGQIVTNLHVVKPWLYEDEIIKQIESLYRKKLQSELGSADMINLLQNGEGTGYAAYTSQLKIEGKLDVIGFLPQGSLFDGTNLRKCRVLSAGEDPEVDVALVKTVQDEDMPNKCAAINIQDSIDVSDEALNPGKDVFVLGFPGGAEYQKLESENGIQVSCQDGKIINKPEEYSFTFNAPSTHGASGSPIFNDKGMLIGILSSGREVQGFNNGIKAYYIKELLESPHKK